jgi:hypothetical protein
MTRSQLVVALVEALAWPIAVIVLAAMLRKPLLKLLKRLSLRRVKALGVVLEFRERKRTVAAAVLGEQSAVDVAGDESAPMDVLGQPQGAIVVSFSRLEVALKEYLGDQGVDVTGRSTEELVHIALEDDALSANAAEAIRGLAAMRNLAVHDQNEEITADDASEFDALVSAAISALHDTTTG